MKPVDATVLVVAKAPVPRFAKTRLMARYSPQDVAELAAAALLDTLRAVRSTPASSHVVALVGDVHRAARRDELTAELERFTVIAQRGDVLGTRLAAAHLDAFEIGSAPVFQIGMDTPQVTPDILETALHTLASPQNDSVLGPAHDGGWWGLGISRPEMATVLPSIPMSRHDTGEATLRALEASGWTVRQLIELADVDTPDDVDLVAGAMAPTSEFVGAARRLA